MPRPFFALLALPALAACGGDVPDDQSTDRQTVTQPDAASDTPAPAGDSVSGPATIPREMRGRWGLVAADCEAGRGDAKGLLAVDATSLEFYESMGRLDTIAQRRAGSIRAMFAFSGEGMEWQREMTLALADGGDMLVSQEFGAGAAPAPLEYMRCD